MKKVIPLQDIWSEKQLDEIAESYNACAYDAEAHGWPKKDKDSKKTQDKKKK